MLQSKGRHLLNPQHQTVAMILQLPKVPHKKIAALRAAHRLSHCPASWRMYAYISTKYLKISARNSQDISSHILLAVQHQL